MAYFAPYVDAAGLHVPSYDDILADNLAQFQAIYGATVYLGIDSADYQWISVNSLKQNDTLQACVLAYNQRSPATAIGSGLDALGKLVGIARKAPTFSTALLAIGGNAGAVLNNCVAGDQSGSLWLLPSTVTIPGGGTINVTATCETSGAVAAPAGTITIRSTPTAGWLSVTNASDALKGLPVETDSLYRARLALSVAIPSLSVLQGTIGKIAQLPGVSRYNILENFTGTTDANGIPEHSIAAVVEGGDDTAIAQAIYYNKSVGARTYGTTATTFTDPTNGPVTINWFRPTDVPIFATLTVHGLTPAFTSEVQTQIVAAVVAYLNSLEIGEELTISGLYAAAMSVTPNFSRPIFSIQALIAGTSSGGQAGTDIAIAFNEVATGSAGNITLNVV